MFIPLAIGLALGTVTALVRVYKVPVLNKFLGVFVTVYQGVPIVVALMIYNLIFMLKFNDLARFLHIKKNAADVDNIWVAFLPSVLLQSAPYQRRSGVRCYPLTRDRMKPGIP